MPTRCSQRLLAHYSEFAVEGAVIIDGEKNIAFLGVKDCELVAFDFVIQRLGLVRHLNYSLARFEGDRDWTPGHAVVDAIEIAAATAAACESEQQEADGSSQLRRGEKIKNSCVSFS